MGTRATVGCCSISSTAGNTLGHVGQGGPDLCTVSDTRPALEHPESYKPKETAAFQCARCGFQTGGAEPPEFCPESGYSGTSVLR